jgi:hypothetical protein
MASNAQIKANRLNAQKSTGPKTIEGKAMVAQNALKHGLFAHDNVIKCEKQADFDCFREELLSGLSPAGSVETMLAERIVSLSWRLERIERMNSEAIDVMIAKIETNSSERRWRGEAGLLDPESGKSELSLGWTIIKDFSGSNVLERLLMYEKRIESSLYKAMSELQKLQLLRKKEKGEQAIPPLGKAVTHRGQDAHETQGRDALATEVNRTKKQTQSLLSAASANSVVNEKQSQCVPLQAAMKSVGDKNQLKS